jgi:hypothetical protein
MLEILSPKKRYTQKCVITFMATSYLTQAQKNTISALVDNVHLTFAVDATAFQINKKTSLSTNPSFNSIYRQNSAQVAQEERSLTFKARIRYVKMGEELMTETDGSNATSIQGRVILPAGSVKMKVDNAAHEFVKTAKRVEISGKRFIVNGQARPIGMFDKSQYWEYFLTPTD